MAEAKPIRYQGEVVEWSVEKRCGFIRPRGAKLTDPLVFISLGSMATKKKKPTVGAIVTYEMVRVSSTPRNKRLRTPWRAGNAAFLGEDLPLVPDKQTESTIWVFGLLYILGLWGLWFLVPSTWPVLATTVVASVFAFFSYWGDKVSASRNQWRTSEEALHFIAAIGGWPGAAMAQTIFRHKTRKASFQMVYRLMIVVNFVLVVSYMMITQGT